MRRQVFGAVLVMGLLALASPAAAQTPPATAPSDDTSDVPRAGAASAAETPDIGHAAAVPATGAVNFKAPDPGAQQAVAPEVASRRAAGDQIICRDVPIVGSRLLSRLCMPKRRWIQMHEDGQEFIRDLQQRSNGGQTG